MKKHRVFMRVWTIGLAAALAALALGGCAASTQNAKQPGDGDGFVVAIDTNNPPFEYQDAQGNTIGVEIALLDAVCEQAGVEYQLRILGREQALAALEKGEVDAVAGGLIQGADAQVAYSEAYLDSGMILCTRIDSDIAAYAQLAGKRVGVRAGTPMQALAEQMQQQYGYTVAAIDAGQNPYFSLRDGEVDALFDDVLRVQAAADAGDCVAVGQAQGALSYAFGINADSPFAKVLDDGLAQLKQAGRIDAVIQSVYESPLEPSPAQTDAGLG